MPHPQTAIRFRQPEDFVPIPVGLKAGTIPALFERIVELHPDKDALTMDGRAMSFAQLNDRSNALAAVIHSMCGTGPEPVVLLFGHNTGAIAALLAVLKIGRPYLALDPAYPIGRMQQVLARAAAPLFLTETAYAETAGQVVGAVPGIALVDVDRLSLPEHAPNLGIVIDPDAPAAVMYTSGSTGEPKGAVTSHRHAAITYITEVNEWFISPSDRLTTLAGISNGRSRSTLFCALFSGAASSLFDPLAEGVGGADLVRWIETERISILRLPESLYQSVYARLPEGFVYPRIRFIGVGGQTITRRHFDLFKAHTAGDCVLANLYYSTECGAVARYYLDHESELTADPVPVGFAWPDKELLVVDEQGQPVPAGERGQVVIRSRNVSSGYLGMPELTIERFQHDPNDPAMRVYRTGDYGRLTSDGSLQLLGREDSMVKVRGYRVELSEVEAALLRHPDIRAAVVLARESSGIIHGRYLAAYLVPQRGKQLARAEIRDFLAPRLPEYMIPSRFMVLDEMPLTTNGKVDRRALPDIPERQEISENDLPVNETEAALVRIWSELFNLNKISVHDNFFELGGDSLMVLSMTLDVERALSKPVPGAFFRQPTIRHLAELLQTDHPAAEPATGDFRLAGNRTISGRRYAGTPSRWRRFRNRVHRWRRELLHNLDEVRLFERILARWIRGRTVPEATAFVLGLAWQPLLLGSIFVRKKRLFRRYLASLGFSRDSVEALFGQNVVNNVLLFLVEARGPLDNGNSAPSTHFMRDRQRLIEQAPISELDELFPVRGAEHLQSALARRRGVILLSFHGTADFRFSKALLARRLGLRAIQTIAQNIARRQSSIWGQGWGMDTPAPLAGALYAEIAFHGQQMLQQGEVIHIAGDISRGPGRVVGMQIGDRRNTVRPGFAELALNTGAVVIPIYGRFDAAGRLVTEILPPLDSGTGSREERILSLMKQYEQFINAALVQHPELLTWRKMRNHLRLPRLREDAPAPSPTAG